MTLNQVPRKYHKAIAVVSLHGHDIGHLYVDAQEWDSRQPSNLARGSSEYIEWMLQWQNPNDHPTPYADGIESDTVKLLAEFDADLFTLRAVTYHLRWLRDQSEYTHALVEVFGVTEEGPAIFDIED